MKTAFRLAILVVGSPSPGSQHSTSSGRNRPQTRTLYVYSGTLRSIDLQARTIIVDGRQFPGSLLVPTDAEIIVKGEPAGPKGKTQRSDGGRWRPSQVHGGRRRERRASDLAPRREASMIGPVTRTNEKGEML